MKLTNMQRSGSIEKINPSDAMNIGGDLSTTLICGELNVMDELSLPQNDIESKDVKHKKCSRCGKTYPLTAEFYHREKRSKFGFKSECKKCSHEYRVKRYAGTIEKEAAYRLKNRDKRIKYMAEWYSKNKDKAKEYRAKNHDKIANRMAVWRKRNRDKIAEYNSQYKKEYYNSNALSNHQCVDELFIYEEGNIQFKGEFLQVKCAYCGKWFEPTNLQVQSRLLACRGCGSDGGENRLYCSDECKNACPTYRKIKYPSGFKKGSSREVMPVVRQMAFEKDNYTCQMCHATGKGVTLHAHHIKSYSKNKILANDIENVITLCKNCHKTVHRKRGCKYHELKCNNEKEAI